MEETPYWLYSWIDEHRVRDSDDAARALASISGARSLQDLAIQAEPRLRAPIHPSYSLLAGSAIDLSGRLDCFHPSCLKKKVDELIIRLWHYFDTVVVHDRLAHQVANHWAAFLDESSKRFLSTIEMLLYLRELGAESLVAFRAKSLPCEEHWAQHAQDAGLRDAVEFARPLVNRLAREGTITSNESSPGVYAFNHPDLEHTAWVTPRFKDSPLHTDDELRLAIARAVVVRYIACLTSDVSAAKLHGLPLGATVPLHRQMLVAGPPPDHRAVAFDLGLPFLHRVPVADLIQIRRVNQDAFENFRDSLRTAVSELAKQRPHDDAPELAMAIRQDVIEPDLRRISHRLRNAESVFAKKGRISISVGILLTTVGLIAGTPPATAATAGIGATATITASAAGKLIDERADVSMSDMYLIWEAVKHIT